MPTKRGWTVVIEATGTSGTIVYGALEEVRENLEPFRPVVSADEAGATVRAVLSIDVELATLPDGAAQIAARHFRAAVENTAGVNVQVQRLEVAASRS